MSLNSNSGRKMPKERVGRISFLLTKWAIEQLSPEMLARAVNIPHEEMKHYLETRNAPVDTSKLFHGTECPECIVGILKFEGKDLENNRVELHCSVCQGTFYREEKPQ